MKATDENVDEFLASIEGDAGESMRLIDARIRSALPGLSRVLWRGIFWGGTEQAIIGYGDLVQSRPRGHDVEWFLIGLAQQKKHISLYVNAADADGYLGVQHAAALGPVTVGAASIGFRNSSDLDLDELDRLLVRARALSGL